MRGRLALVVAMGVFVSCHLRAGTPDEDPAVADLYRAFQAGSVPSSHLLTPGITWHCTYFQAERGNFYRASTYLQFYAPRKDGLMRAVMRVTYPRRVTSTTYYGSTPYGLLSVSEDSRFYTSLRQTGPAQIVIEYFERTESPQGSPPLRYPALTVPGQGLSLGYAGCLPVSG